MVMSVVLALIAWDWPVDVIAGWPRAIDPDSLLAGAERFLCRMECRCSYATMVVRPFHHISHSVLWKTFDRCAIEGLLQGVAKLQRTGGYWFQQMQNGSVNTTPPFLLSVPSCCYGFNSEE